MRAKENISKPTVSNQPFFKKQKEDTGIAQQKHFFTGNIQPELTVGHPDDPFEKEADKIGRQVMNNFEKVSDLHRKPSVVDLKSIAQAQPVNRKINRRVQKGLYIMPDFTQKKCDNCENEEEQSKLQPLSLQKAGDNNVVGQNMEQQVKSRLGRGKKMDSITRSAMETSFGADFSSVNIHTDRQAAQMSQDLNAHAFTVGNDIFFNQGRYRPQTKQGAGLLAHELTHTIQQGAAMQTKRSTSLPGADLFRNIARNDTSSTGDALQNALIYRKEIAQFQENLPEEEMIKQQQELMDDREIDQVQMKDNARSLRKYEGNGGGGTAKTTPPKLTKKSVAGPKSSNCGGFTWTVQWLLDKPSPTGGVIIQKLDVNHNMKKCSDNSTLSSGFDKWVPYWEAWEVNKGQKVTTYAETGDVMDDTFSKAGNNNSKGTFTEEGTAEFFEGAKVPASMKPNPSSPAGILPFSKSDPKLKGGSGAIQHSLTATWNCCEADKSTKIKTV